MSIPALQSPGALHRGIVYALGAGVAVLSVNPIVNMLSPRQVMNSSFEPLHLVNTYGAFGGITRMRREIVIEGTSADALTAGTTWRAYEFKGKPGDPSRLAPQITPYHLRLDWLMWFAAMSDPDEHPWFAALLARLLEGDPGTLGLLKTNPFPDRLPRYVRAFYYAYRFTTPDEHRQTGRWWARELLGLYYPPATLRAPEDRHEPLPR